MNTIGSMSIKVRRGGSGGKWAAVIALSLAALAATDVAQAKGCLKGAAVGAVGGHVAGGHAVLGAAAGCAIGHHEANKKDKDADKSTQQAAPAPASETAQSAPSK